MYLNLIFSPNLKSDQILVVDNRDDFTVRVNVVAAGCVIITVFYAVAALALTTSSHKVLDLTNGSWFSTIFVMLPTSLIIASWISLSIEYIVWRGRLSDSRRKKLGVIQVITLYIAISALFGVLIALALQL